MDKSGKFNVMVSIPTDHPDSYDDVVKNATSLGMSVDHKHSAPELKTFVGSVTEDVYERLRAVPGLHVSHERKMGFA